MVSQPKWPQLQYVIFSTLKYLRSWGKKNIQAYTLHTLKLHLANCEEPCSTVIIHTIPLQATGNIKIASCFESLNEFVRKERGLYLFSGHIYEIYSWGQQILSRFRSDYRWGVEWGIDLLTTYAHHLELKALIVLWLISHFTNHNSTC
jgi:hypothetical protein